MPDTPGRGTHRHAFKDRICAAIIHKLVLFSWQYLPEELQIYRFFHVFFGKPKASLKEPTYLHLWKTQNATMTLSFHSDLCCSESQICSGRQAFSMLRVWTCQTHSNTQFANKWCKKTCFALALHHNWSFSTRCVGLFVFASLLVLVWFFNFSASLILLLISFLLLALHPELQRVCVFNVLHHGNFCWGLQLHLGLHQGHEIPQGCWKGLTILKVTKTEEGLQTLGTIYLMRVCCSLFGCVPSPYPSSSLTVTETRIRWVKRRWISGELGLLGGWWAIIRFLPLPSYMGTRWNKELASKWNGMSMKGCFCY